MKRGVVMLVVALASYAAVSAQSWTTLFDGSTLDGWNQIGDANWRLADGAVESNDKVLVQGPPSLSFNHPNVVLPFLMALSHSTLIASWKSSAASTDRHTTSSKLSRSCSSMPKALPPKSVSNSRT